MILPFIASAMPNCSIRLPICVPLGVAPGVACTTARLFSIACLTLSGVDRSGFGAPVRTTAFDADKPRMARPCACTTPLFW